MGKIIRGIVKYASEVGNVLITETVGELIEVCALHKKLHPP